MAEQDAVAVAYVHSDEVASSWHHSVIELLAHDLEHELRVMRGGWVAVHCGTGGLVESRNLTVQTFLAEERADWLFWIDTDMGFTPDTVDRLLEVADPVSRPIVGALCFASVEIEPDGYGGYRTAPAPTIYDFGEVKGSQGFVVRWEYARNTLLRCTGTGSACILIHRSVFEKIEAKHGRAWYDRVPNTTTGHLLSEDLSFCLRAGAMNIPVHVHTGVLATHMKLRWLTEEDYLGARFIESRRVASNGDGSVEPEQVAVAEVPG